MGGVWQGNASFLPWMSLTLLYLYGWIIRPRLIHVQTLVGIVIHALIISAAGVIQTASMTKVADNKTSVVALLGPVLWLVHRGVQGLRLVNRMWNSSFWLDRTAGSGFWLHRAVRSRLWLAGGKGSLFWLDDKGERWEILVGQMEWVFVTVNRPTV